jgi:hypothetical protein
MIDGVAPRTKVLLAIAGLWLARTVTACEGSISPVDVANDAASPGSTAATYPRAAPARADL